MKKTLHFSVVVSVTGNLIDPNFWPSDFTLSDFIRECDKALGKSEPTEPGNSEYHYLAKESRHNPFQSAVIESLDGGNKAIAEWAIRRYADDSNIWWATCSDYQNSGVLTAREFFELLDSADFHFEDCGTMGTLGGPLSIGCVPDVAFGSESKAAIVSMRATPFWKNEDEEPQPVTDATWERLKKYYRDPFQAIR